MCCGIIQTLRNAVFGENLSLSLPPLETKSLLIENKGNNFRYISKRCFNAQLMWFYGYFTNGYSVNSTKVFEEIHDNSSNSDQSRTKNLYLTSL